MNRSDVVVPRLEWLIGGSRIGSDYNTYIGSLGTDPLKGCMNRKIFNYLIRIEKSENDESENSERLCAYFWIGMSSFANTPGEEIVVKSFPLEEESREKIRLWLEENAAAVLK